MRALLPLMPWPWPWPRRMTTIWPAHEGWECMDCAGRNAFHYWQLCSHCGECKPWWEWPAPQHVQWMAPHNVVEAPQRLSPERQEWLARENVAGGVIWQRPSPAHATESSASGGGGQAPPASGGCGQAPSGVGRRRRGPSGGSMGRAAVSGLPSTYSKRARSESSHEAGWCTNSCNTALSYGCARDGQLGVGRRWPGPSGSAQSVGRLSP